MSFSYLRKAFPYIQILGRRGKPYTSKKLYRLLIRESGDFLVKAISELCWNFLNKIGKKKISKQQRKFLEKLSSKTIPLDTKRRLLLASQRNYELILLVCRDSLKILIPLLDTEENNNGQTSGVGTYAA